jgi:4-aminobutyrate aminotransferase-like enzyme/Ser/Thr protein kinase RdoA (MazF antagonist)
VSSGADKQVSVLEAPPPRFTPTEVERIASELLGIDGTAFDLGSERDQTFLVDDGVDGAIVKISNLAEDPAVLDMEAAAILHVARVDPSLPVARPRMIDGATDNPYRTTVAGSAGAHFVRVFERLRGRTSGGAELDDAALYAYGSTHARLNVALRAFFHPAAGRELLWDLEHALKLRPLLDAIADRKQRALVENVLDRFQSHVQPRWPRLRAHVVHGDLNLDNVLVDGHGQITGIVDFGDLTHTAEVADFAIGLASLLRGRAGDDVFRSARIVIDGYAAHTPLEDDELAVLGDLVAVRLAAIVAISAWRSRRYPENSEYIRAQDGDSWALLELFDSTGPATVARQLGASSPPPDSGRLTQRRQQTLGAALLRLSYKTPVHVVRGQGVWLFDNNGERLLDAYNNVPVVGHCHPRVTEAVVRQTRLLNTHSRYLYEPLVELAERLTATMPPAAGLDTVMLVNSGSEANDLAWRIATATTGNAGAIATSFAYHGVSTAIADVSPEEWPIGYTPSHVALIDAGGDIDAELASAVGRLQERKIGLAATFLDGGFTSDGILRPPATALATILERTHAAGGLFVADEVQIGHGRTGQELWSFVRDGITPDIVTLGKPMGNGYPVAAVITRKEIAERFAETTHFFSTFGGNPVAARAALAVLDVIEDEQLIKHVSRVGEHLTGGLRDLANHHPEIAAVRSHGLLIGVELVSADDGTTPNAPLADRIVDQMRERHVLIGKTGPHENVLKIRPPLPFENEHADILLTNLHEALG